MTQSKIYLSSLITTTQACNHSNRTPVRKDKSSSIRLSTTILKPTRKAFLKDRLSKVRPSSLEASQHTRNRHKYMFYLQAPSSLRKLTTIQSTVTTTILTNIIELLINQ